MLLEPGGKTALQSSPGEVMSEAPQYMPMKGLT
jgi:hypothetical protein